jgi:hypothetical protein
MNVFLDKVAYVLQGLIVLILIESMIVKIMGLPGEIAAFSALEMESSGRYFSVVADTLAVIGMVVMRFVIQGAVLALLIFSMGIFFTLTELAIDWYGDGGFRFYLTVAGFLFSLGLFIIRSHLANVLYRRGKLD